MITGTPDRPIDDPELPSLLLSEGSIVEFDFEFREWSAGTRFIVTGDELVKLIPLHKEE